MAGLVPQRDPVRRRPEGPALPHHRPRVRDVLAARHGGAGAERARYVPGAAVRRARRRRVYRPLVGFRPRLLPGRQELLLAGRRPPPPRRAARRAPAPLRPPTRRPGNESATP